MQREHREAEAMKYRIRKRFKQLGMYAAYQSSASCLDRTLVHISEEKVFKAYMEKYTDDDSDFVNAAIQKAKSNHRDVPVYDDSILGRL